MRWVVALLPLACFAQSYEFQGWAQNMSISGVTSGYYDKALPTNQPPSGTFWPQVGPDKPFADPLGTRSFIFADSDCIHPYSSRSTVSVRGTYGYIVCSNVHKIYNMHTGAHVMDLPAGPAEPLNTINWSALHDSRLYAVANKTVRTYDVVVGGGSWTTLVTFDGTAGRPNLTVTNAGTADGSDIDHFAFVDATANMLCVVDVETAGYPHACYDYSSHPVGTEDNAIISKGVDSGTGRRYLMLQGSTVMQLYYTTVAGGLTFSHLWESFLTTGTGDKDGILEASEDDTSAAHSDTGFLSDGRQIYVRPCDLSTPARRSLCVFYLGLETAVTVPANVDEVRVLGSTLITTRNWPGSNHIGCAKLAPVCIVSSWVDWYNGGDPTAGGSYQDLRPLSTTAEPYQSYASGWLVEKMYNGGEKFRMIAHTRGQLWEGFDADDQYYTYPRAAISPDGRYVMYATNFGVASYTPRVVFAHTSDPGKALRVTNKAATTATLRYVAPSAAACTVTVDDSGGFGSPVSGFSAVSDGGGTNERSVSITGLTTATTYYVRVNCGINAVTSFTTR